MKLQPKPKREPFLDADPKQVWLAERMLLDVSQDDPKDILAFIKACEAADLHQFDTVHGLPQEVGMFRAILSHPKCDRATALNIFAACQPAYFERLNDQGMRPADLEEDEDKVTYQILLDCYFRLKNRETWRGRFAVNAKYTWAAKPETHPERLKIFRLSPSALRETKNEPAKSAIIYEYSMIALSFEAWQARR